MSQFMLLSFYSLHFPPSSTSPLSSIASPLLSSQSLGQAACEAVSETHRGLWCAVVFCLWGQSCAMLLFPGPRPFPIVCCHMEASTNTEISPSSCCSLTFSGTQLALNAEIIIIPITQANSVSSSLCVLRVWGEKGWGSSKELGDMPRREASHHRWEDGLMLPCTLTTSLLQYN